jgi:hypothetical protein
MAVTLIVHPALDDVETYMRDHWANPISKSVERRVGSELGWGSLEEAPRRLANARSVLYVGHGDADALGKPPVIDASNVGQIKGVLVAIACDSGERLGPAAVAGGTSAYVGFAGDVPVVNARSYDDLIVDHFAPLAMGDCTAGDFALTFGAACDDVKVRHLRGPRHRDAHLIALSAEVMRLGLRILGDHAARC